MTTDARPRADGAPAIGWRRAAVFAAVVTVIGFAASALVGLVLFALLGVAPGIVPGLLTGGVVIGVVGFALHTVALVAVPPLTKRGVFGTAVLVGYVAVGVACALALTVTTGAPAVIFTWIPLALFTVTGAFLVPGTVAVLCSPLLDPRFARASRATLEHTAARGDATV